MSRFRDRAAEWIVIAAVIVATIALSGCAGVVHAVPDRGPMSAAMAEDYARLAAGASVATIEVLSSRLSTYGAERPGGTAATPDTAVWSITLKGALPYASCAFNLGPGTSSGLGTTKAEPTAAPCPPPALRQRILLHARDGRVIERVVPA